MSVVISKGIVVHKIEVGDNDIVRLYSATTIVNLFAMGTRKLASKNRPALQLGNVVEIEYFRARLSSSISRLKRATLIAQPPITVGDTAEIILDVVRLLQMVDLPSKELLTTYTAALPHFGHHINHHLKSFIYFQALGPLGLKPQLNGCHVCNRTNNIVAFTFFDGGYSCVAHAEKENELAYLQAIRVLGDGDFSNYLMVVPKINQDIFRDMSLFLDSQLQIIKQLREG